MKYLLIYCGLILVRMVGEVGFRGTLGRFLK